MKTANIRASLLIIVLMPAYWMAYMVTGLWLASHVIPMKLMWWDDVLDWHIFEEKLSLKIGLLSFYGISGLIIGIWGHVAANRARSAINCGLTNQSTGAGNV